MKTQKEKTKEKSQKEMIVEMHSMIMNCPPLTPELVNEIFVAIIDKGTSPSADLVNFLARHSPMSAASMRAHFRDLYHERTFNDDDPFETRPFAVIG